MLHPAESGLLIEERRRRICELLRAEGRVMVEALACGTPVVSFREGAAPEIIDSGETGFLVDNVTEAVRSLERISEIDRRACRRRVQQYFSIETMVAGYERVYSTIFDLEAKRRP